MSQPVVRTVADSASTNGDLLALIGRGAADDGLWLRAERQSAGRGRMGRAWIGDTGNLYLSTIVRLSSGDPPATDLALLAAVAVHEACAALLPDARALRIKWPNDLVADGAKLAGMLLERGGDHVVAGIGVNVTHAPQITGRATTCLHTLGAASDVDASGLAEAIATCFNGWLSRWRAGDGAAVRAAWVAAAEPVGTAYHIVEPDGTMVDGRFAGLASDGALMLDTAGGDRRHIHAGDVFHLRDAGEGMNHAARH